ncbi:MAG: sugar transferase [Eudoraea sp.]|nr:sugar transferase [Eudoraea sp.]
MKRAFDFILSFVGLVLLTPLFLIVALLIKLDSKGPVFYMQSRVGRFNNDFKLFKFRTMTLNADRLGLLTLSSRDERITKLGYYLRKYKVDELPQLINVLKGDMSLVGPRPEVRKYVDLYSKNQMKVLDFRPGITDVSSIRYSNENEVLENQSEPEKYYIEVIMPEKIKYNLEYLKKQNILSDIQTIFRTLAKIVQ